MHRLNYRLNANREREREREKGIHTMIDTHVHVLILHVPIN